MSLASRVVAIVVLLLIGAGRSVADDAPPRDRSIFEFGKPPAAKAETDQAKAKVDAAWKEMNRAILRGEYDQAVKSATAAEAAAKAMNDPAISASAAQRLGDVQKLQSEAAKAAPAIAKLREAPDDAGANVEAGRFLCFWRGDWEKGLPLLAKGADSGLKAIAQEDIAAGADVPMQFGVANAWWDLAANLEGPPRAYAQDRAAELYVKVVARLEGINHTTAQTRIAQAPVRLPFPKATVAASPVDEKATVATSVQIVCDDFACDIYHDGKLIPAENRKLQAEVYGAQVETITVDLKPGDWLVFNVVNNRMRWGGAYYFAAAGINEAGGLAFASDLRSGNWSACDDLKEAAKFIADRDHLTDNKAQAVKKPWDQGDQRISKANPEWNGQAIWGDPASRNTWLKYVVPGAP
jgi:hypothetical protein